jgi:hypothetical protein
MGGPAQLRFKCTHTLLRLMTLTETGRKILLHIELDLGIRDDFGIANVGTANGQILMIRSVRTMLQVPDKEARG